MTNQITSAPRISQEGTLFTRGWIVCLVACLVPAALMPLLSNVDWEPLTYTVTDWVRSKRAAFVALTSTDSNSWIFYPAILMLALSAAVRLLFKRPPDFIRLPVGAIFFVLQVSYLSFRALATLNLETWPNGIVSVLFFLSEVFIHARIALGNLSLLRLTNRSPQADDSQRAIRAGEFLPRVDIFVPT